LEAADKLLAAVSGANNQRDIRYHLDYREIYPKSNDRLALEVSPVQASGRNPD